MKKILLYTSLIVSPLFSISQTKTSIKIINDTTLELQLGSRLDTLIPIAKNDLLKIKSFTLSENQKGYSIASFDVTWNHDGVFSTASYQGINITNLFEKNFKYIKSGNKIIIENIRIKDKENNWVKYGKRYCQFIITN